MVQEDKELLIKDLCARLPYGVICNCFHFGDYKLLGIDEDKIRLDSPVYEEGDDWWYINSIKPYLRPMSSMTEEEVKDLIKVQILSKHGKEGDYYSLNNIKSIKNIHFQSITNEWYCDVTFSSVDGKYTTCYAIRRVTWETTINEIDWLNAHHIDFRGLIPMGLAIEAPEGMYKTK